MHRLSPSAPNSGKKRGPAMRTPLKLLPLAILLTTLTAHAQTYVELSPAGSQTITQPSGTSLNLSGSGILNLSHGTNSAAISSTPSDDLLLQSTGVSGAIVLDTTSSDSGGNVSVLLAGHLGSLFQIIDNDTPSTFFCASPDFVGVGDGNSCSPYDQFDVSNRETFGDGYMHWFASGAAYNAWNAGISNPSTGVFSFDTTTDGNALATIKAALVSAGTGFAIPGATTAGHYLRNNGTDYVDSSILASDLPGVVFTAPTANQTINASLYSTTWNFSPAANAGNLVVQSQWNGLWAAPGYSNGSSGTSATGWALAEQFNPVMTVTQRGIAEQVAANMDKTAIGDTPQEYHYLTAFGGTTAGADEGVLGRGQHTFQRGFVSGVVTAGASTGSTMITAGTLTCTGFCSEAYSGNYFADGGILLDTQTAGITATVTDCNAPSGTNAPCNSAGAFGGMSFDISGATVTPSTAWGNIIPSSCTGNGNGHNQTYTSTTCNVTLASGSGNFNTSSHIFLSGPFEEEAAITAAGTPVSGVQSITFSTRYAWDNANGNTDQALVMQGGPGGQSLIVTGTSSWPVAYFVIGATTSTRIYFSNCFGGRCDGSNSYANAPVPAGTDLFDYAATGGTLTRTSGTVTFTNFGNSSNLPSINSLPVGSMIVVSGWAPSDLNGTFTVTANSRNIYAPSISWSQSGTNETSTTPGPVSQAPLQVTLYPSAFVIGTNNGVVGVAQLGTNHVAFTTSDTVVGAPTAEYHQLGYALYGGQTTASDGADSSAGYFVYDSGPSPMFAEFSADNSQLDPNLIYAHGAYSNVLYMYNRPANNGCILCVLGNNPVTPGSNIPYSLFTDNAGGANLTYAPATNTIAFNGPIAPQQSTPASSSAACTAGQMWTDASYIYVCTATNTIKRAALSSF